MTTKQFYNMFWQEVHHLDQQVTLAINSWHSPISDPVWQFFSDKLIWIPMYVAIVALLIWKLGWKKGLIVIAAAGLTFGFCDQFSNIVKHAVERIRPLKDTYMLSQGLHVLENGGGYSFFSAHAANAFGLACSTFVGLKTTLRTKPTWLKVYGWWMFIWALMVAISRIFVGKHYLGDVLVGTVVGIAAGLAFGYLAGYVTKKIN
ncbi:MAG: phosphatase PAP2 family protein [Bacteroidales bacterium]|nr:phosphatase PAP2 family protein [Bacteroidales bacterium]